MQRTNRVGQKCLSTTQPSRTMRVKDCFTEETDRKERKEGRKRERGEYFQTKTIQMKNYCKKKKKNLVVVKTVNKG